MNWLWSILSTTTSTIVGIGLIMALFYFGGPISEVLKKVSVPVAEWFGKTAPEIFQGLWDGIKGLSDITLKTAIVLALVGGGLYIGGKSKCDCKAAVQAEVTKLRKDYQFVTRKKPQQRSGGLFNVF